MRNEDYKYQMMLAHEGFIRRAAMTDMPFMLKGSYVSRQYFDDPSERIPADLDWFYLVKIDDQQTASSVFSEWIMKVTATEAHDFVHFNPVIKEPVWALIDYAMTDDFPTVSTCLECWVDGYPEEIEFSLDISFNLPIGQPPVKLMYKPFRGDPFMIRNTVPLSLQVAWKMHQTCVRPRFKDIFDLVHLVQHASFDNSAVEAAFRELMAECRADNDELYKLHYFFNYEMEKLFMGINIADSWNYWRHTKDTDFYEGYIHYGGSAGTITDVKKLPEELADFLADFRRVMESKGFTSELLRGENIPTEEEYNEAKKREDAIRAERYNRMQEQAGRNSIWQRLRNLFR